MGEPCYFCGGEHGDERPEFKDVPSASGDMDELLDVTMTWRCAGGCGEAMLDTASSLMLQGWVFTSTNNVIWADCPKCGESASRRLQSDVSRW
jgi:hypothetical protein